MSQKCHKAVALRKGGHGTWRVNNGSVAAKRSNAVSESHIYLYISKQGVPHLSLPALPFEQL